MNSRGAKHRWTVLILLTASVFAGSESIANEELLFDRADAAAKEARLAEMQRLYEEVLQSAPNNERALAGKAAAQAWQGDYEAAQQTYRQVIGLNSANADTWVGLGYAHAWAGEYTDAHTAFHKALGVDSRNISARKGIAYAYLWAGDAELALESFEVARSLKQDDSEIAESSGMASLSLGRTRDAVAYFDQALALEPQRESARAARRSAFLSAPALELSTRFGTTSGASSGIRTVEIAHWADARTRLAVRYDNTLGLDNPSIANRGEDAPGYFGSVQLGFGERWTGIVEAGRRDLLDGNQTVVGGQGIYRTGFGNVRAGVQIARHEANYDDRLLFVGANMPLWRGWRLDPALYLSRSGVNDDSEWRAVVGLEKQQTDHWAIGAFAGTGRIDAADSAFDGSTTLIGLRSDLLVADRHTVHFLARRESAPTNDFTVVEIGFTYRLLGN